MVSLCSGSRGSRSLHAAANHNHNDEHHNNHRPAASGHSRACRRFRAGRPRQLWDARYARGMSADATSSAALLPAQQMTT
jgi:hypothetical protein